MNKFGDPEDQDYQRVARRIEEYLQKIREGIPLQRADACIRKHYADGKLKIVRLSGEELDMSQCYINLAIVKEFREEPETRQLSLFGRLNVETPNMEASVELPALFNSRQNTHDHTKGPRRILIRGRAGVGKTTLCKKIVHDFIHKKMWDGLFARVLWVPLRELKKKVYTKYNLSEAFLQIYFKHQTDGKTLANSLWDAVKKADPCDSLFILDGLDEVVELLDPKHEAFSLLAELLNSPNVIITTRPNALFPNGVEKPTLELETIGFYLDQVHTYVEEVMPKNAKEIRSFLQRHKLIQSLVRIPIQLDALCLTWDENFKNNPIPETMTAVYEAIVQRLWRKDILRLGKLAGPSADMASNAEIEERTETEAKILEYLAFSGMYNNLVEFQPEHRDGIRKLATTTGNVFDELLGELSFLRSSNPSERMRQRSYHFLHLTFQEFFAAKYFVRQWEAGNELKYQDFKTGGSSEITTDVFLRQEKYTGRYDIFWRFTVGLLSGDKVPGFFEAIEHEPLDLVGPTHQRLVMHCLTEANALKSKLRSDLESRLSGWLIVQSDLIPYFLLTAEAEFPDGALLSALERSSDDQKTIIIQSVGGHNRHLSDVVVTALVGIIKDKAYHVATAAAITLGYQSKISEAVIARLGNEYNRRLDGLSTAAEIKVLGKQSNSSNLVAKAVVELFEAEHTKSYAERIATVALANVNLSEAASTTFLELITTNNPFQHTATGALKYSSNLSMAIIPALVRFIENECNDEEVRLSLIKALRRSSHLPETAITALVKIIENECCNKEIRAAATSALQRNRNVSETTIMALVKIVENKCYNEEVRVAAASALDQQNLPETAITALVKIIENECYNKKIRAAATSALKHHYNLSETAITALVKIVENKCYNEEVRVAAFSVLESQCSSERVTAALVKIIENERCTEDVRVSAVETLMRKSSLSEIATTSLTPLLDETQLDYSEVETVADAVISHRTNLPGPAIKALIARIGDRRVRRALCPATAEALNNRKDLPETAIAPFLSAFEYKGFRDFDLKFLGIALLVLENRTNLSEAVTTALVGRMREVEYRRSEIARVLGKQTNLSEATIKAIILLHQNESIRSDIARHLGRESNLSDKIAEGMKSIIESEGSDESFDLLKLLYGSFLHRGFSEQFCMYMEEDHLVIYLPNGSRIRIKVPSRELAMAAIDEGRRLYLPPGYSNLWPGSSLGY